MNFYFMSSFHLVFYVVPICLTQKPDLIWVGFIVKEGLPKQVFYDSVINGNTKCLEKRIRNESEKIANNKI